MTKVKYEDVDHKELICQLGWLTVRGLIELDLEIFMYQSQNNLLPETAGKFIYQLKWFIHMKQDQLSLETCFCQDMSCGFTQKSIAFSGAKMWNEIPVNIKKAPSIDLFTCRPRKKFELFALSEHRSIHSKEERTAQYHML